MDKLFINGRFVSLNNKAVLSAVKSVYWGLGFTRLNSVFTQLGLVTYVKMLFKENLIKKRLVLLQKFIKKFYIYDRFLRRKYDAYVDFYVKFGHYRGFCLQNGLPVRGQRTKSNGATSNKLNRKRVSPAFLTVSVFRSDTKKVVKKKSKK